MNRREALRRAPRALALALLSMLIAVSLTCSMSIEPYYAGDEALAGYSALHRFLTYCARSFSAELGVSSCLGLGAGFLLYGACRLKPARSERALAAVFGGLFAFMQVLGRSYAENQSWDALFGTRFLLFRAAAAFAGQALLAACLRLTDSVLNTVVYNLVHSLLYAVCFTLLTAVLRFVLRALKIACRLPGLRQLNEAGGMLVGVGKGVLLAYVCAWILSRAGVLTEEMIQGSVLLGLTKGLPPGMQV